MFSKLLVALATAVVLSHSAPADKDLYSVLFSSSQFMNNAPDNTADFSQYMSTFLDEFNKWHQQINIPGSTEYQALVAAQNGNTVISSDKKVLLQQYLNNYFNQKSVIAQASQTNVNSQQSSSVTVNKEEKSSVSSSNVSQNSLSANSQQGFGNTGIQNSFTTNQGVTNVNKESKTESHSEEKSSVSSSNVSHNSLSATSTQEFGNTGIQNSFATNQGVTNVNKESKTESHSEEKSSVSSSNVSHNSLSATSQQGFGNTGIQNSFTTNQGVTNVNKESNSEVNHQSTVEKHESSVSTANFGQSSTHFNGHQQHGFVGNNGNTAIYNQPIIIPNTPNNAGISQSNSNEKNEIFNELVTVINEYDKLHINEPARTILTPEQKKQAEKEAHDAQFAYEYEVNNNMEGNYLQKSEARRGGKVFGKYSYDDSNSFITKYYIADENGFRIVKSIEEPSRKVGHTLDGTATVRVDDGKGRVAYDITEGDIHKCPFLKPVPY